MPKCFFFFFFHWTCQWYNEMQSLILAYLTCWLYISLYLRFIINWIFRDKTYIVEGAICLAYIIYWVSMPFLRITELSSWTLVSIFASWSYPSCGSNGKANCIGVPQVCVVLSWDVRDARSIACKDSIGYKNLHVMCHAWTRGPGNQKYVHAYESMC